MVCFYMGFCGKMWKLASCHAFSVYERASKCAYRAHTAYHILDLFVRVRGSNPSGDNWNKFERKFPLRPGLNGAGPLVRRSVGNRPQSQTQLMIIIFYFLYSSFYFKRICACKCPRRTVHHGFYTGQTFIAVKVSTTIQAQMRLINRNHLHWNCFIIIRAIRLFCWLRAPLIILNDEW